MGRYLDKFRSTMPAVQGKQIIQMLGALKDAGTIRSIPEYNAKLQELSQYLRSTNPQPFFKFFQAQVGDIITSDKFNAMIQAARLDLEAAFGEANTIAEVLELHENLFKLTVLKALEQNLDDLEKAITQYEFLNAQIDKWDVIDFNTFNTLDGQALSRQSSDTSLFYDPIRHQSVSATEDCVVDVFGQQLVMPTSISESITITDVSILNDTETALSIRNVSSVTGNIQNIRDGKKLTYWLYPVLVDEPVAGGIRIKLRLDLGGLRDLNTLQIEPASPTPMILEQITYMAPSGTMIDMSFDLLITSDVTLNIGRITASELILTFKQVTYEAAKYHRSPRSNMWERIWTDTSSPEIGDTERLENIATELNDILQDSEIVAITDLPSRDVYEETTIYQYTFGFDNIRCYLNKYQSRGLFVSQPVKVESPGLIALRTTEEIPTTVINNVSYPACSLEYYIVKQNYNTDGIVVDREVLPILPAASGLTIANERLFLNKHDDSAISNVCSLRFVPDLTTAPVIKTNLISELTMGDEDNGDFQARVIGGTWRDSWSTLATDITASSLPAPIEIQIKIHIPSPYTIYTINYVASSRDGDPQRDINPYVLLQDNGTLRCFENHGPYGTIQAADVYLVIIMRNNSYDATITPVIEDYKLLISSHNSTKFLE